MFRRSSVILAVVCLVLVLKFLPAQSKPQIDDAELQALKSDSQKMHVMLNQLRTNLAFVDSSQSPLKHQFELEADMWQAQLGEMDRRIAKMEAKK